MGCGAVIPAAGSASRLGTADKTLLPLDGSPVLEWVLRALIDSRVLAEVVIATSGRNHEQVLDLVARIRSPIKISTVPGGESRQESVHAGVLSLSPGCQLILIHDAARPVVSQDLIARAVQAAGQYGAVIPAIPTTDTIKRVKNGQVQETLDRSTLVSVQTPQVFRRDWLLDAYQRRDDAIPATDESSILEQAGYPVHVIEGEPENIKITTPADIVIAETLLAARRKCS
jgi:2-C-methyl-D-erythritol 4-phosphate cytidylyltransferase